ncbi:MAG TPA: adenylate/guanylate cyclase domain-containing protein [Propionibacteriaceae bacterium]|nr:adenylate/guanylate cyclase domain-containing protein [Propionibacteriaceae bacterium]
MAAEDWNPEKVRSVLAGESSGLVSQRRAFRRIPSPPRCKLCAAPFGGLGGLIFRHAGYRQSAGNPALCTRCITVLRKRQMTGVEIPVSLLFSDIRGSTAMGERMRPADFHAFLDRFYRLASDSIVAHDGIVDKVVGDEVIGLFFGGITGAHHPAAAVAAAIDLAQQAAHASSARSDSIPAGTAVHTGEAFVGATGSGTTVDDFTALGDVVNITARLASAAVAGEVIVSVAAAQAAGMATDGLERRTVEIRGRTEPIEVVALPPPDGKVSAR